METIWFIIIRLASFSSRRSCLRFSRSNLSRNTICLTSVVLSGELFVKSFFDFFFGDGGGVGVFFFDFFFGVGGVGGGVFFFDFFFGDGGGVGVFFFDFFFGVGGVGGGVFFFDFFFGDGGVGVGVFFFTELFAFLEMIAKISSCFLNLAILIFSLS